MIKFIGPARFDEYDAFISTHPKGHFMQTRMWGEHKSNWKWDAVLSYDDNGLLKGTFALLIRKVPLLPYSIMYGCRGPVCDPDDTGTLRELISGAKTLAKKYHCYEIRLDPDVKSDNTLYREALLDLGFLPPCETKNFESIQPRYVFRLDIAGKTEEEVFNLFESKTRYNIRLSQRKGVTVSVCGKEYLGQFHKIMCETGKRDNFVVRREEYFKSLLDNLGENARLYLAFYEGAPIAGTIAIKFAGKVWYLYGASCGQSRNVMPNYCLQWEMIRWAISSRCGLYDFRGVSGDLSPENPLYGLYRFKKGFNGEFTEFLGEFNLILNPFAKRLVDSGRSIMHKFRKTALLGTQE